MKRFHALHIAALAGSLLLTGQARAGEASFTGDRCLPLFDGEGDRVGYTDTAIYAKQAVYVICYAAVPIGSTVTRVDVGAYDGTNNDTIVAVFKGKRSENASIVDAWQPFFQLSSGVGPWNFSAATPQPNRTDWVQLEIYLPGPEAENSWVLNYKVVYN